MRVRTPDGNYVALGYRGLWYAGDFRGAFLGKMFGGQWGEVNSGRFDGFVRKPDAIWLRLEKKGFSFIGSFSLDGSLFETLGEQTMLRFDGSRLDLVAHDESQGVETAAKFDYVEVIQ